jgi:cytochrome c biogenesis protein CcdA
MNELWAVLIPILLADIVNPVLFAFLVYAAGTSRPIANSTVLLLGHTAAYFIAGIAIAMGLEQFENRLANPKPVDFAFEFFVGLLLLWVAIRSRNSTTKQAETDTGDLKVLSAFFLGAIVNFVGIPFAIPYFAALSQILKADVSATEALLTLIGYNLAYALPFTTVPVMRALMGDKSRLFLEKTNAFLNKVSGFLMPAILLMLGLALVIDAIYYFVTGEAVF